MVKVEVEKLCRTFPSVRSLSERVAEIFTDSGSLAHSLPTFESRPAQRQMAEAVAGTLENGGVLLVEAGTGTGKTLAYLVPAILSGQRVLISTGTKNLQEQIYFKDLAVLREALDVPFTATYMKGRGNYLCLHRFESFREGAKGGTLQLFGESAAQIFLPIIDEWSKRTETGDRAEIADLPEDLPFWGEIAATSENCIGTECPRYTDCFVTRMRSRAADSNLIVVNHHLLCADAAVRQSAYGEVIPECSYAIVDEAHQLEDVATQYFGVSVSTYRFDELARDGDVLIGTGLAGEKAPDLREALDRAKDRAHDFFRNVAGSISSRTQQASENRVRVTAKTLEPLYEDAALVMSALDLLEATAALIKPPPPDPDRPQEATRIDLAGLSRRAGELRDEFRFILRANEPDYVYFLETRGRGLFLRAAPIDVSTILRDVLFDRMKATVLTSATLTVEGTFDYVRSRLGLERSGSTQFAEAATRVRLQAAGDSVPAAGDARPALDRLHGSGGKGNRQHPGGHERARVRALHQLRGSARDPADCRGRAAVSDSRAGICAAIRPARPVPYDAERGAAGHVELLAGGRRDGRRVELRHHRQAAVCVAGRSHHRGTHRSDRRPRGPAVRRVPGAARHPDAAAGPGTPHTSSRRSRRPGGARSAAPDHGLRAPVSGVAAAGRNYARDWRHRTVFRREIEAVQPFV